MKRSLLYLFIVLSIPSYSQNYFSRILPTEDNPLVEMVEKINDRYIIPIDFFSTEGVKGGFLEMNQNGEVNRYKFDNIDLCAHPLAFDEDNLYLLGQNPNRQGDSTFFISIIDQNDKTQDFYQEYSIDSPRMNPRTILIDNNDVYAINVELETNTSNYPQELSIYKFSKNGESKNIWRYNTNKRASFAWESFLSMDKSIIISCLHSDPNPEPGPNPASSQVIKINTDGETIWNYEGKEHLDNGAVPTWITELSDSTILQTYIVDHFLDLEYIINDWNPYPNKFIWLSKDGELIKEKIIISEDPDDIIYSGVKRGFGNYFFAYGELESLDPLPGLKKSCHLTKFSNSGDTIWTHNYQHPDFSDNNNNSYINDIIEEENGDITVLATLNTPVSKNEVWLFKLNSDGCYINSECEDMTNLVSVTDTDIEEVTLYPNPVINEVTIKSSSIIKSIKIRNTAGVFIKELDVNNQTVTVEMKDFPKGLYNFQIFSVDGKMTSKQLVKW